MAVEKLILEFIGKDEVSKTTKGITGALGKLGGVAVKGLAIGAVGATAAVAGLGAGVGALIAEAMPLEGVQGAFEGITESVGTSADTVLEDFKKFSAGMITNREAMESFNQASQLVGETFALQLPEAMGYLGKVSNATGEDVGFMLDSLVKGVGRLSPMILDNLGIQVNLTEANEAYAEQLGKSASELTKSEQQTALMNQVMEKLATNTAAMPELAGTATQGWASFQATLKDTTDQIGLALIPAVTPLLQLLSQLAAEILPPVGNFIAGVLVPALQDFSNWIKEEVVPRLKEFFKELKEKGGPALQIIKEAFDRISEALGLSTGNLDLLDAAFWVLDKTLDAIIIGVELAAVAANALASAVEAIRAAIDFVIGGWNAFRDSMDAALDGVPDWLIPGSPTQFEIGLRGIGDAMSKLGQFQLGTSGGFAPGGGIGPTGGFGGPIVVNLTYSPVVSLADQYEAETRLAPFIANGIRRELEARGAI